MLTLAHSVAIAVDLDPGAITAIEAAEFVLQAGPVAPYGAPWAPVTLTDRWPQDRYDSGREGWYRMSINLDELPPDRIGIFVRRLNMNAELYLNGVLIASGGQFSEPIARNWNYPMYAEPPLMLWRQGENILHVRHISYRAYGYLSTVYVGPAALLRPQYETAYTLQIGVAKFLFPVTIVTVLFIFAIWWRRKKDAVYFWFAAAVAAWSVYIVNMFVRQLIIPTRVWEWIAHISIELWVVAFFVFSYRFVGLRLGKLAWALAGFIVVAAIAYATGDLAQLRSVAVVFHGISLLIGFALIVQLSLHWLREKTAGTIPLTIGLLILLATAVHDWLFQTGMRSVTGTLALHLHYYCAPLVFAFIAWHLTARYASAVDELEELNLNLAERIADAEAELSSRYEQIRSMEQREAVLQERDRIAREIHDTIGGRFSSAIMMTDLIKQRKDSEQRLDLLRTLLSDGLSEVRHLVTAMIGDIGNTGDLIYYIADKTSSTLRSVDIDLHLNFDFSSKPETISNLQALNVVRVFQEATNNIIKHSRARSASLTASDKNGLLLISLTDTGIGLPDAFQSGQAGRTGIGNYGIAGMNIRCADIAATLKVANDASAGCCVSLSLQL